jgi:uncharacterized protein
MGTLPFQGVQDMAQAKPPEAVLKYVRFLSRTFSGLKKAYVFGSYAKGSAGADSDIDIAFVFDNVADSFDLQVELMKIRRQFDARIEPHVFRTADFDGSHPLAGEILSTGVEIP